MYFDYFCTSKYFKYSLYMSLIPNHMGKYTLTALCSFNLALLENHDVIKINVCKYTRVGVTQKFAWFQNFATRFALLAPQF